MTQSIRSTLAAALILLVASTSACGGGGDGPSDPVVTPSVAVATVASLAGTRGASGTVDITITRRGGYTGTVTLGVGGMPTGVTAFLNPSTLSGTATTATLTLVASATATITSGVSSPASRPCRPGASAARCRPARAAARAWG